MKKLLTFGVLGLMISSCGLKSECGSDVKMACNLFMGYDPVSQVMVDNLDRNVKKLANDLDLQGQFDEFLQNQINALKTRDDLIQNQLDDLFNKDTLTDDQIAALEDIISNLNTDLGDRIHDLSDRLEDLESDTSLSSQISALNIRIYDLENDPKDDQQDVEINQLKARVVLLETAETSSNSSITIINNQLAAIQAQMIPLQNGVISEVIDPCGDYPNHYDEVLLKMGSGTIIAYFESGNKRFLSIIKQGNYRTTDKQKCHFSVDINNNVTF